VESGRWEASLDREPPRYSGASCLPPLINHFRNCSVA